MRNSVVLLLSFCMILAVAAAAPAATFTDSANANVLRQWDPDAETIVIPSTVETTGGAGIWRQAVNDGSTFNDEGKVPEGATLTKTFELPGFRSVGSFMVRFEHVPSVFVLEGMNDLYDWVELTRLENEAAYANVNGTFTPTTVQQLRYRIEGPTTGGEGFGISELRVFLESGQTVALTDGYDFLRDKVAASYTAQDSDIWHGPNGVAENLVDGDFTTAVKDEYQPYGEVRTYVAYELSEPCQMNTGTLGFAKDHHWLSGYAVYTANGLAMPELQELSASDQASILAAGWTLQYESTGTGNVDRITFAEPGDWQYLAIVWDSQWGAAVELEIFAGNNPLKINSFEVADQQTGNTETTTSPVVDITALDVTPSYGATILGYIITEDDIEPPLNDPRWAEEKPTTYIISSDQGAVTIYAHVLDSDGQIASASANILFEFSAGPGNFNSSTNVNVLRRWNVDTDVIALPYTVEASDGASIHRHAVNDGGGHNDEGNLQMGASLKKEFDLGGEVMVGGYMMKFESAPSSVVLEGYTSDEIWVGLVALSDLPTRANVSGSFTPTTVTKVRYNITGPTSGGTGFGINEMHIYMAAGQAVSLTDGYNIMVDQAPTCYTSVSEGVWSRPQNGSAETLIDGDFAGNLKCEYAPYGSVTCFVAYEFEQAVQMNVGTLGFHKDNHWYGGYEIYTANGAAMPELQNLPGNDQASLEAAGWILQYATESSANLVDRITFAQPGDWQYLALVWDSQWGNAAELEVFAGNPPLKLNNFEVADQATGDTTRTTEALVDVTAFDATPSYGATITGYMINEYDFPPFAQQTGWLAEKPTTYTITSPPGNVTLYAWVKDSADQVVGTTYTILYESESSIDMFRSSTHVNVLRQYVPDANDGGSLFIVPWAVENAGGSSIWRHACTDGSGFNDEGKLPDGSTITKTFTLRSEAFVGSYYIQHEGTSYPASYDLEGSMDGTTWFTLATVTPDASIVEGSFAPKTVNYIRYIAHGPTSNNDNFQVIEFRVLADASRKVDLTEGYNMMSDQVGTSVTAAAEGVWLRPSNGTAETLINEEYRSGLKCEIQPYGENRTFVAWSFDNPQQMNAASLGFCKDQHWANPWEVYTSNADVMPDLQNLAATDTQTIQDAGWTLQHEGVRAQVDEFEFLAPGEYKHVALVWTTVWGNSSELEVFGYEAANTWPIEGDANMDCKVNIIDLIFVRNRLNQDVGSDDNWQADVNGDGKINIIDLIYVRNRLNTKCE